MTESRHFSVLWIVAIVSIAASAYLTWQWFAERGEEITIDFVDASGLIPDQSGVYYRGTLVGRIADIALGENNQVTGTPVDRLSAPHLRGLIRKVGG